MSCFASLLRNVLEGVNVSFGHNTVRPGSACNTLISRSETSECRHSCSIFREWCVQAEPGATVFMPKGHVHTFKNISKQAANNSCLVYPAGIEQFFWEVHELA